MTQDALPFVVYAEEAALIDAHRYYSRDRRNAIESRREAGKARIAECLRLIDETPPAEARALLDAEFARRDRGY